MAKIKKGRLRLKLYQQQGGVCFYCERKMVHPNWNNNHNDKHATLDHLIPKAKGGADIEENIVLACRACNAAKADMMPRDFLEHIGII